MPTNTHSMVYEVVKQHPDWAICCQDIDHHLHYAYPSEHGWRVYKQALGLYPLITLADLTTIAAHAAQFEATQGGRIETNVDILLVTEKEFYGTKGLILDKLTDTHYQVTVLNPEHLLEFLAGLKTLTITVMDKCIVIEEHALPNYQGLTKTGSG